VELASTIHNRRRLVTAPTAYLAASLSRQSVVAVVPPCRLLPLTDGCGSVDRPAMQQMRKAFPALESDQGQAVRTSVQRRTGDRLSATRMLLRARTRGTIAGSVTAGCRHRARQGVGDVRVNDAVRCVGRQHRARLATDLRRPRGCTGRRRLAPSTAGLRPGHLAIALALAKSDVQMAKCS
jgi:hypothetical protein